MYNHKEAWLELVLNKGLKMLEHFIAGIELPRWLAPFSMMGLLASLVKLLPSINKGSILAGVGGYLLVGLLIVNALALSLFLLIPGKLVRLKTSLAAQARWNLLKLMLIGFFVILGKLITISLKVVFSLAMLVITALTYPSRPRQMKLSPC